MADTALNDEEIQEFYDDEDTLSTKVEQLAAFVRDSQHFAVYTGAGISTSAGIPDFRGPDGVWTLRAKGQVPSGRGGWNNARPTLCHMALVQLQNIKKLHCLVSQNCDGLHLKSGISPTTICELHGNTNVEACSVCGKVYYRAFRVRTTQNAQRVTGRRCSSCKNPLRYTTVAFGQSMPDLCLQKAEQLSRQSDLSLCMGTSMRVSPACDLPLFGRKSNKNHKLVIINLQKTPYDSSCALRIFAKVDTVMTMLMKHLNLEIPNWEDLNLTENEEWMQNFENNWKFRTAGSSDWFKGEHQVGDSQLKVIVNK